MPQLNRLEAVAVRVNVDRHPVTLVSVYNPPGDINVNDIEILLRLPSPTIIAGDMNAKHVDWNCRVTNPQGNALRDLYYGSDINFEILAPSSPTFIPDNQNHAPDILEIALVKDFQSILQINAVNALNSDHLPVIIQLHGQITKAEQRTYLKYDHANWEKLEFEIHSKLEQINSVINSEAELNDGVNKLTTVIQQAIENNVPRKIIKQKDQYVPDTIKRLIRQRNDARRKWQRHHDNQNYRGEMNDLRYRIRQAFQEHVSNTWDTTLGNLDTRNMSETWKITKKIMHQNVVLPPLNAPHGRVELPEEKAEMFANHLEQTFSPHTDNINEQFTRATENLVTNFLRTPVKGKTRETIPAEIAWQIRHLNGKKARGPDGIQNIVLQKLPPLAIQFLAKIINAIFKLGKYPELWKEGRILLFPNPGKDLSDPDNYRPITLLNTMGKVAEKIINKRLKQEIAERDIIRNEQFGFRSKHSTTSQLLSHVEKITEGFNRGRATVGLYLDISQAFDKIWHTGLLRKLINNNINDNLIQLVANYLSNRKFDVQVQGVISGKRIIRSGVPQGSIVGPTLFNLYINDIPHDVQNQNSMIHIFADDTLISGQSWEPTIAADRVQQNLILIEEWLEKWRLKINIDKCQAVLFSKRTSHFRTLPPELKLFGEEIQWRNEAKYLGVILDKKLLFSRHIDWTKSKAYMRLRILYPLLNYRSHLNMRTAITLYKSLIRPIMSYACPVWGHAAKTHIKKLQIIQNKILYMATKLPRVTPLRTLHREANVEMISEHIRQSTNNFYRSREGHSNPLVERLGRYDTEHDVHKRPLAIL